jgi:hypothetical protein
MRRSVWFRAVAAATLFLLVDTSLPFTASASSPVTDRDLEIPLSELARIQAPDMVRISAEAVSAYVRERMGEAAPGEVARVLASYVFQILTFAFVKGQTPHSFRNVLAPLVLLSVVPVVAKESFWVDSIGRPKGHTVLVVIGVMAGLAVFGRLGGKWFQDARAREMSGRSFSPGDYFLRVHGEIMPSAARLSEYQEILGAVRARRGLPIPVRLKGWYLTIKDIEAMTRPEFEKVKELLRSRNPLFKKRLRDDGAWAIEDMMKKPIAVTSGMLLLTLPALSGRSDGEDPRARAAKTELDRLPSGPADIETLAGLYQRKFGSFSQVYSVGGR